MKTKGLFLRFCLCFALVAASGIICLFFFAKTDNPCLIRKIAGVPCLTCGMTRAWLAFFGGDLGRAFYWHPLFWAAPVLFFAVLFCGINSRVTLRVLLVGLFAFTAVYAVRMALYFPHTEPMTVYPEGLLQKIFGH